MKLHLDGWGFSGKLFFFFQTCCVHTDLGFVQVTGYEWSKHLKMTTHGFPKFQVEELGESFSITPLGKGPNVEKSNYVCDKQRQGWGKKWRESKHNIRCKLQRNVPTPSSCDTTGSNPCPFPFPIWGMQLGLWPPSWIRWIRGWRQ